MATLSSYTCPKLQEIKVAQGDVACFCWIAFKNEETAKRVLEATLTGVNHTLLLLPTDGKLLLQACYLDTLLSFS